MKTSIITEREFHLIDDFLNDRIPLNAELKRLIDKAEYNLDIIALEFESLSSLLVKVGKR